MTLPGFTAADSLRCARKLYSMAATLDAGQASNVVHPQLGRPTGPYGPIGLPGQDCEGACLHVCMMNGGWGTDKCIADCVSTCAQPRWSRF
jgi:hypothetical protein